MGRPLVDLAGHRFGRLSVLAFYCVQRSQSYWRVRCDCGTEKVAQGGKLRNGTTYQCGCSPDRPPGRPETHGQGSVNKGLGPEYRSWIAMRKRRHQPRNTSYPRYGGRGISVCDRWRHDFAAFLADMGPKPTPQHTIDRIDPNGNYEPANCRWATMREQENNRRGNRPVTAYGVTMNLAQWARAVGLNPRTLASRIDQRAYTPERALNIYVAGV